MNNKLEIDREEKYFLWFILIVLFTVSLFISLKLNETINDIFGAGLYHSLFPHIMFNITTIFVVFVFFIFLLVIIDNVFHYEFINKLLLVLTGNQYNKIKKQIFVIIISSTLCILTVVSYILFSDLAVFDGNSVKKYFAYPFLYNEIILNDDTNLLFDIKYTLISNKTRKNNYLLTVDVYKDGKNIFTSWANHTDPWINFIKTNTSKCKVKYPKGIEEIERHLTDVDKDTLRKFEELNLTTAST